MKRQNKVLVVFILMLLTAVVFTVGMTVNEAKTKQEQQDAGYMVETHVANSFDEEGALNQDMIYLSPEDVKAHDIEKGDKLTIIFDMTTGYDDDIAGIINSK